MTDKYKGKNDPRAIQARWMQAYGKQPTQMRMNFTLKGMVNKYVLGVQMCKWLLMLEREYVGSTLKQKVIHMESLNKVCNVLNKVCNVQQSDWDLCVPIVLWASRTTCKKLTNRHLSDFSMEWKL